MSILFSFLSIAYSYYNIRNKNKNEALSALHIVLLIAKVFLEVLSKVLIFFCFMIVANNGEFDPIYSLVGFYTTVLIMVVFNIVFNESPICFSLSYIMGGYCKTNKKKIIIIMINFYFKYQKLQSTLTAALSGKY